MPAHVVRSPDYVTRSGVLDDVDGFDPGFFGIGRRDAAVMDPQHRHFLECAWEALESAGHVPERFAGAIGVFGGCGMNTYLINNLLTNPQLVEQLGWFLLRHTGNDKDFLTTTASYRLDLRGPGGQRADGLLDVARRRAPRRAEPARLRVRPGARRRRDDRGAARPRLRVPRGRDPRRPTGSAGRSTPIRRAPC